MRDWIITVDDESVEVREGDWRSAAARAVRRQHPGMAVLDDLRWRAEGYYPGNDIYRYVIAYGRPCERGIAPEGEARAEIPGELAARDGGMTARIVRAGRRR